MIIIWSSSKRNIHLALLLVDQYSFFNVMRDIVVSLRLQTELVLRLGHYFIPPQHDEINGSITK